MKIRLGYVAIALNLGKVTSSSTLTYSRYSKLDEKEQLEKLKSITYSNLGALEKILNYNIDNGIHFYRITSNLIPLATHPNVLWDYKRYFKEDFKYIGKIIRNSNMRVDLHPDQFNVINSLREDVVKSTLVNLNTAVDIFELINYDEGKLVLHVGSAQGGKEKSIERFINNFNTFPDRVKRRIILENDDKIFTAKEVLEICKTLKIPMVLDIHHHNCNNEGENIEDYIEDIFKTWSNENLPPKIHFSSPREFENDKKHSDFINSEDFISFLDKIKNKVNVDFDVMIEAKKKDQALFELADNLKKYDNKVRFIDKTTIETI